MQATEPPVGIRGGNAQAININNGFGLLFNWNLLGTGQHTIRVLADGGGGEFARATFTVTTLGEEFLRGASRGG